MILVCLFPFTLQLTPPLQLAAGTLKERRGWLVRLQSESAEGWGEISPLPGFSRETSEQIPELLACWLESPQSHELPPSLSFGLSCAWQELQYGKLQPDSQVASCQLLLKDQHQLIQLPQQQIGEVKLKVGGDPVADRQRLLQLLEHYPGKVRLDANRQWSLEQALAFAHDLPMQRISFIEEPIQYLGDEKAFYRQLEAFYIQTAMPLALDETLQQADFNFQPLSGLAALVIKPTLIGSIQQCRQLARLAKKHQLKLIFSSSFESSLGVGQIAALAKQFAPGQLPGLDTLNRFTADLLRPWPHSDKPLVEKSEILESPQLQSWMIDDAFLDNELEL